MSLRYCLLELQGHSDKLVNLLEEKIYITPGYAPMFFLFVIELDRGPLVYLSRFLFLLLFLVKNVLRQLGLRLQLAVVHCKQLELSSQVNHVALG